MNLPAHLKPVTYWEKRCKLMEESLIRVMDILNTYALPPTAIECMREHVLNWDLDLADITKEHPAPSENTDLKVTEK